MRSKARFKAHGSLQHVAVALTLLVPPASAVPQSAQAQTLTVLHAFAGGTDGASASGLNRDSAGSLYGITAAGGASGLGNVFKLDPIGNKSVLYSFVGGTHGATPTSLIRDSSGNFYGTTASGGGFGFGTIFRLDATGKESVLYSFPGGASGASPGSLIRDNSGNFYGTTAAGGANGLGTVFKLDATGRESVLLSFWYGAPLTALTLDPQGNLYGTTSGQVTPCILQGPPRSSACGTVYKLDPAGNFSFLLRFHLDVCCDDAAVPRAGLTRDAAGNLYGTTVVGGAYPFTYGTVFKLPASGPAIALHGFSGADGSTPTAAVVLDTAGNVYGTTSKGGAFGLGTVFKLGGSVKETVLHSFTGAADGANPDTALILDAAGNLYGATASGGTSGFGTVFKLAPSGTLSVAANAADSAAGN
jgi:uncharacterized repeat protein (TIGR03803 family)